MGEAKRRKKLLGDNYGKPKTEVNLEFSAETKVYIPNVISGINYFMNTKLGKSKPDLDALKELVSANFFDEFEALLRLHENEEGTFNWARLQIFKAALLLLADTSELEAENVSYITSEIRQAGMIMYQVDGMRGLEDRLVWSFLPKRWHRFIDEAFNGIGTWVS